MTKKNNANSARRKLIPAVGMLVVSAMMLSSSTYAWFTMNDTVSVTGMAMHTTVSDNLLVDDAAPLNGGSWTAGSYATNDSTFKSSTQQTIDTANVVVPLSTVDGKTFYYTAKNNVKGNGDAIADTYTQYTDLSALQTEFGQTVTGAYLDYHFVLKATNTDSSNAKDLKMTELNLKYSGASDTNKAFRVAVFAEKFNNPTVNGSKTLPGVNEMALADIDYKKLFAPSGATNFTTGEAVNGTSGTGTVTYVTEATDGKIATVAAGATEYYEVIVRLWLEGEDTTCNVEVFKGLASGNWSLETGFSMNANDTAVSGLTMEVTTPSGNGSGNGAGSGT